MRELLALHELVGDGCQGRLAGLVPEDRSPEHLCTQWAFTPPRPLRELILTTSLMQIPRSGQITKQG